MTAALTPDKGRDTATLMQNLRMAASVAEALAWIERLKPRRAVLTNLHVDLDYAKLRSELPAGVEPAYDGMELEMLLRD